MMEAPRARSRPKLQPLPPPLDEIYRRIVRAHASLNEVVSDDPKRIGWVLRELMDTLDYIEKVADEGAVVSTDRRRGSAKQADRN